MSEDGSRDKVLSFWFSELTEKDWFSGSEDVDDKIRNRFSELHSELAKGTPPETRTDPNAALAAVIVLDQFSRNMFRKQPAAFSADTVALDIARHAVEAGLDTQLPEDRRWFLYMPFMHSESLVVHGWAVELFTALGVESVLRFELEHKAIIERFERYPHRNEILGRESTRAELDFLAAPRSLF